MRIGIVSPFFYPWYGGITEHVYHQYRELKRFGHTVRILSAFSGEGGPDVGPDLIRIGRSLPLISNGSVTRLSVDFDWNRAQDILSKENFDILHLHQPLFCPLNLRIQRKAYLRKRENGVPKLVGTFHTCGGPFAKAILRMWRGFFQQYVDRLDLRIAVSQASKEFHGSMFSNPYEVIPNGVDIERFSGAGQTILPFMDGCVNILFVGRPEPRKGIKNLLRSMDLIPSFTNKKCRLIIVGDGPFGPYYRRMVSTESRDRVVFAGKVTYADLPAYYRSAHLFCSPAAYGESFGIVLVEAMAAGLPIIAGDNEGYRRVIQHNRNGILVDPHSPRAIAQGIASLAESEEDRQRYSSQNRLECLAFSWADVFRRIETGYRSLLDAGPGKGGLSVRGQHDASSA